MNSQFHTPSLGDGFDLSGVEESATNIVDLDLDTQTVFQQQQTDQFESKRMQSMDQNVSLVNASMAEMNNYPVSNSNAGSGTSGIFNITAHLNNNLNSNVTNSQNHGPPATMAARKQMLPSANDSNEPPKPLSPYTLFFRDTVSAIKQQNPNCAFADLTRIVSSMWEALDPVQKDIYNKKAEAARNEYLKQLKTKQQITRNDGQSGILLNNEAPTNVNNSSNYVQDHFPQAQQNSLTLASTEIQMTTPQMPANAPLLEAPTNPQPNINLQETMTQQMPIARETANMELCIRDGCNKRAIMNPDWEDEYCSNECVVIHCRNVFNDWVQQNKDTPGLQQ